LQPYSGQQGGSNYAPGQYDPYAQGSSYYPQPNPYGDSHYQNNGPTLNRRAPANYDPDGDIVRAPAHQLAEGTTINVHLIGRLSSSDPSPSETGRAKRFRTRVVSDVIQYDHVLIPADSEIDGQVLDLSRGHLGSGGTMHLRPDTVILRDGTRYKLAAQVTGAPGAKARVGSEGTIKAGSRLKRDTIEYGGAMGAGAGAGAYLGGPAGAIAGAAIGAGVITVHLLVSHNQATLESGTPLQFTLTRPLDLVPSPYGN
jgi:hypothetical protein